MQEIQYIQEDEIDLRDLFRTIIKNKKFIIIFTFLITISAAIYSYIKTPIYSGSVLIEVGKVILTENDKTTVFPFDNTYDLKEIISRKFSLSAQIPKRTKQIIKISYSNKDKKIIDKKLDDVVDFIIKRHEKKINLYSVDNQKVYMTSLIDKKIGSNPVKPKKNLIIAVAFVTGLILSIFLVFFIEFFRNIKNEKISESNNKTL